MSAIYAGFPTERRQVTFAVVFRTCIRNSWFPRRAPRHPPGGYKRLLIPEARASGLRETTVPSDLARYYDVVVDWEKRLAREIPLLRKILAEVPSRKVLVAGCGTGGHVLALAREGFEVIGIDSDPAMVEVAQKKLDAAAEEIRRARNGSVGIHPDMPAGPVARQTLKASVKLCAIEESARLRERFGAALCLGNTLPNLSAPGQLEAALRSLYEVLLPGGIFFIQNLNYDKRWREKTKWFPLLSGRTEDEEVILFKVAEYGPEFIDFHAIFFTRPLAPGTCWDYRVNTNRQIPLFEKELRTLLERIGFEIVSTWSDYSGAPFDVRDSSDLLLLSRRPGVVPSR